MNQVAKIIFWIFVSTVIFALIYVAIGRSESVLGTINDERKMLSVAMGSDVAKRVYKRTEVSFNELDSFVEYGYELLPDKNEDFIESEKGTKEYVKKLHQIYRNAMDTFWVMVYQSIQRFYIIVELLPIGLLLCLAGYVDGNTVRAINGSSFRYSSPIFYKFGFLLLFGVIMSLISILTLPIAIPFSVFLVGVCVLGIFVRQIMANMPNKM